MTLALRYAARSDVGMLREGNEDSAYVGPHLLAIADGMGGHAAGEVASSVAIVTLAGLDRAALGENALDALARAVATASGTLRDMSLADPSVEGMGTTLTAMYWSGGTMAICHIGDSRAYLLRDGELAQITRDHTLVQTLVDDGRLTPEEAAEDPRRSLVMRALQSGTDAEPDLFVRQARAGDRYVLCSDGLTDVVSEETLHQTLIQFTDRDKAILQLIDLANRGGGPDNITCIVADVIEVPDGAARLADQAPLMVGAASSRDGRTRLRTDSPAGRAHLLSQGAPQAQQQPPTRQPTARPEPTAGDASGRDGADAGRGKARAPRRRWPVVTSVLVVLVLVIFGGGYAAWRYTQAQYYVGTDGSQVIIYRGINQKVAGLSLSSVYRRTGFPLAHVPVDDKSQLQNTITASNPAAAERIVRNIQRDYNCQQARSKLAYWQAHKPKPVRKKVWRHGKRVWRTVTPKYNKPKPTVPSYCPAQGGSG